MVVFTTKAYTVSCASEEEEEILFCHIS